MIQKWNSAIIFINRKCNAGCKYCSANASEISDKVLHSLVLEKLFGTWDKLKIAPYVVWTGGEPFLTSTELAIAVKQAANLDLNQEILTSGSWPENMDQILTCFSQIKKLSIRFSLDSAHQRTIPLEPVLQKISDCIDRGIQVNFSLRQPSDSIKRSYRSILHKRFPDYTAQRSQDPRFIHILPTIPMGNAAIEMAGSHPIHKRPCGMAFRDLVISETGQAHPCCGLFTIPVSLEMGEAASLYPEKAMSIIRNSSVLLNLSKGGPWQIAAAAHRLALMDRKFVNPCHACQVVFHDPDVIEWLKNSLKKVPI